MKILHFSDNHIGSLDWELPRHISNLIEKLPEEKQAGIMLFIESYMKINAHILFGTMFLGPRMTLGIDIIEQNQRTTLELLTILGQEGQE